MNTEHCTRPIIPNIAESAQTETKPAAPTVGSNAFEQALHKLGVKPFDRAWVTQFKKEARLAACPSVLTRLLSQFCEKPMWVLPLGITLLTVGALFNGFFSMSTRGDSVTEGWGGSWFLLVVYSYFLGLVAGEFLDFPVWRKTLLRNYREPIPRVVREFIESADTLVKGVTWKVERLTMSRDPFLLADCGGKTYYLKRWEDTPPKND